MSDNITSTSTADLPTVEEINGWSRDRVKEFLQERRAELNLEDEDINIIYNQRVRGDIFPKLTEVTLERWGIPGGPAIAIAELVKRVKREQYIKENKDLKYHIFYLELANTRNSASVYRHVRERGEVQLWKIEEDITPLEEAINDVFNQYRNAPAQGLSEINVNRPFCKNFVSEIVNQIERNDLLVVGDNGDRREDEVFPDIIIGPVGFYAKLTKNPPDLSKGLGWE
ncbi:6165_t:CDS:2, partial [Acaulospora morrowiae]